MASAFSTKMSTFGSNLKGREGVRGIGPPPEGDAVFLQSERPIYAPAPKSPCSLLWMVLLHKGSLTGALLTFLATCAVSCEVGSGMLEVCMCERTRARVRASAWARGCVG